MIFACPYCNHHRDDNDIKLFVLSCKAGLRAVTPCIECGKFAVLDMMQEGNFRKPTEDDDVMMEG